MMEHVSRRVAERGEKNMFVTDKKQGKRDIDIRGRK